MSPVRRRRRELPSLDELLAQIPHRLETVDFHFSPDRFGVTGAANSTGTTGTTFMVRGPFAAEGESFQVPPTARH